MSDPTTPPVVRECIEYKDGVTCWTFALDGGSICINCRRNAKDALFFIYRYVPAYPSGLTQEQYETGDFA